MLYSFIVFCQIRWGWSSIMLYVYLNSGDSWMESTSSSQSYMWMNAPIVHTVKAYTMSLSYRCVFCHAWLLYVMAWFESDVPMFLHLFIPLAWGLFVYWWKYLPYVNTETWFKYKCSLINIIGRQLIYCMQSLFTTIINHQSPRSGSSFYTHPQYLFHSHSLILEPLCHFYETSL